MIEVVQPQVSVLMPVYNGERYLEAAIDSVLGQTMRDFEFIIIDDGSRDSSFRIIEHHATKEPRIRVIRLSHQGIVAALNKGIEESRGDFIARMDADDICFPKRLEKQVSYMLSHPDCVLLGTSRRNIDCYGIPVGRHKVVTKHEAILRKMLNSPGGTVSHPTAIMRADVLKDLGGYDPNCPVAQDVELFLRLAEHGAIGNLPEPLLLYRIDPRSATRSRRQQQWRVVSRVLTQAWQRRGAQCPPDLESVRRRFDRLPTGPKLYRKLVANALYYGARKAALKHTFHSLKKYPSSRHSWQSLWWSIRGTY